MMKRFCSYLGVVTLFKKKIDILHKYIYNLLCFKVNWNMLERHHKYNKMLWEKYVILKINSIQE